MIQYKRRFSQGWVRAMAVGPFLTERLIVREIVQSDWKALHQCASNPLTVRHQGWGPNTPGESLQFIADAIREQKRVPRVRYEFAVLLKQNRDFVGVVGLTLNRKVVLEAELGYTIDPGYWNNGFATEAASRIMDFAFNQLHVFRIVALCNSTNTPSMQILNKLGLIPSEQIQNRILFAKINRNPEFREKRMHLQDSSTSELIP